MMPATSVAKSDNLLPKDAKIQAKFEKIKGEPVGSVKLVEGEGYILHKGDNVKAYKLENGLPLFVGDTVLTSPKSRAKLQFNDESILSLSPKAKLIIKKYLFNKKEQVRDSEVTSLFGKIRFFVKKHMKFKKTDFVIKSFTSVSAVRGSDFIIDTLADSTDVKTLDNTTLEVNNINTPKAKPVKMTSNQKSTVKKGQAPTTPVNMSPAEIKNAKGLFDLPLAEALLLPAFVALPPIPVVPAANTVMYNGKKVVALEVSSTEPENDESSFPVGDDITVEFSAQLNPKSVDLKKAISLTVSLAKDIKVPAEYTIEGNKILISSIDDLLYKTNYTIKISKGLRRSNGEVLTQDVILTFDTENDKVKGFIIEAGTLGTFGSMTVEDTKVKSNNQVGNIILGAEYRALGGSIGFGVEYEKVKNKMTGSYSKPRENGQIASGAGSYKINRDRKTAYVRYVPSVNFNIKVGYAMYKYNLSEGVIDMWLDGSLTESERDCTASTNFKKGAFGEMNVLLGQTFQFRLSMRGGYFFKADYNLSYNKTFSLLPDTGLKTHTVKVSAAEARALAEFSYLFFDKFRFYVNGSAQGAIWLAEDSTIFDDLKSFPGFDALVTAGAGVRVYF
jgi:hypothetical protein